MQVAAKVGLLFAAMATVVGCSKRSQDWPSSQPVAADLVGEYGALAVEPGAEDGRLVLAKDGTFQMANVPGQGNGGGTWRVENHPNSMGWSPYVMVLEFGEVGGGKANYCTFCPRIYGDGNSLRIEIPVNDPDGPKVVLSKKGASGRDP